MLVFFTPAIFKIFHELSIDIKPINERIKYLIYFMYFNRFPYLVDWTCQ